MYGGGEPSLDVELRGSTMGGEDGVKRKDRVGKEPVVAEDARLRIWVLQVVDEDVRLRTVGEVMEEVLPLEWERVREEVSRPKP